VNLGTGGLQVQDQGGCWFLRSKSAVVPALACGFPATSVPSHLSRCGYLLFIRTQNKEKANNLVLFDKGTYDKLMAEVPKYKMITQVCSLAACPLQTGQPLLL
jgi:hypothetical protein